ncbi:MAG TPA: prefoldin subunit beta [archaeon]|nr:prefoldin subunit beta [archaeon]
MPEQTQTITLPPEAQQLLVQMQTFQHQYQTINVQREALSMQKIESEKALEELKKAKDKEEVFKIVGPVLVKSTKSELIKELGEKKETAELRLKSLEKQEEMLRKKLEENQKKLEGLFKGLSPSEALGGAE